MNNASLVNQDSGVVEYYTQLRYIEYVKRVFTIDLDPASNVLANKTVGAKQFFTKEDNGLLQPWHGNVFMNHPFHRGEKACAKNCKKEKCKRITKAKPNRRGHCITQDIPGNAQWVNKLVSEYQAGRVKEAICLTFSSMSEDWMWPLLPFLQCFPKGRIAYQKPDGTIAKEVTKGSLFTYLGPNPEKFKQVFSEIGVVK